MRDLVRLPKAHLHVHLESAVRWSTLREIADAHGVAVPTGIGRTFSGFRGFADVGSRVRDCLRRPEDFTRIAREFCEDQAADGVRYVEVTFTAASHGERLGDLGMPLAAVLAGLDAGRLATGIDCRVILDHSRRRPVTRFWRTLELARAYPDAVVAIGLAGEEQHPVGPFVEVLAAARTAGVHLVHHAGETLGAASIRDALDPGGSERLGHGIRILDDDQLVADVRALGVPLEVCPSSNVALGLVPSFAEHPLPRLRAAGLAVTLNTDIPAIIGTTLTREYQLVREVFGAEDEALAGLAVAGVDASFAPEATKSALRAEIAGWLGALA